MLPSRWIERSVACTATAAAPASALELLAWVTLLELSATSPTPRIEVPPGSGGVSSSMSVRARRDDTRTGVSTLRGAVPGAGTAVACVRDVGRAPRPGRRVPVEVVLSSSSDRTGGSGDAGGATLELYRRASYTRCGGDRRPTPERVAMEDATTLTSAALPTSCDEAEELLRARDLLPERARSAERTMASAAAASGCERGSGAMAAGASGVSTS